MNNYSFLQSVSFVTVCSIPAMPPESSARCAGSGGARCGRPGASAAASPSRISAPAACAISGQLR
ncbi:MAG: hypothetical protein DMD40_12575 [Gemmatimonadetes bacterium]|nr:MAG: hypothetical protein DMD40_12575 [Gemmatimonadota bacterium]